MNRAFLEREHFRIKLKPGKENPEMKKFELEHVQRILGPLLLGQWGPFRAFKSVVEPTEATSSKRKRAIEPSDSEVCRVKHLEPGGLSWPASRVT